MYKIGDIVKIVKNHGWSFDEYVFNKQGTIKEIDKSNDFVRINFKRKELDGENITEIDIDENYIIGQNWGYYFDEIKHVSSIKKTKKIGSQI